MIKKAFFVKWTLRKLTTRKFTVNRFRNATLRNVTRDDSNKFYSYSNAIDQILINNRHDDAL